MSIADATRDQAVALYRASAKLALALNQIDDGSGNPPQPGRYTVAEMDAMIADVKAAATAVVP